jgi:hypothetical protein
MTDLPPLPVDPDVEEIVEDEVADGVDPWPRRCELIALILAIVLGCSLLGAGLVAAGLPLGGAAGSSVDAGARLRYAAQNVSPISGVIALVAVLMVALEGISTGVRSGPSTPAGRVALYGTAVMSAIVAVAGGGRGVDLLAGHINFIGPSIHGALQYRAGAALAEAGTLLLGVTACACAFWTLDDRDKTDPSSDDPRDLQDES